MIKMGLCSMKLANVYCLSTGTICGKKEKEGPYGEYFDFAIKDQYYGTDSFEKAEQKMLDMARKICLQKAGLTMDDIDLYVGGDLNNQLGATNYMLKEYDVPYLGAFAACATLNLSIITSCLFLETEYAKFVLVGTSSHNGVCERQFRYPCEYGGPKAVTLTSTATAAGSLLLTSFKTDIKITKVTIGKVFDSTLSDPSDLGRAMAPAAADTLRNHLRDFGCTTNDYDLILTGDLSKFGASLFKDILLKFDIRLGNNYMDAGESLYKQKSQNAYAGGSGCGCVTLMSLGYVIKKMWEEKLDKVLVIATGALHNPIILNQKETIPVIAHAVVFEREVKL